MQAPSAHPASSDRVFFVFNAVLSAAALAFLYYILLLRRGGGEAAVDLRFMPAVNAGLNALSATLLVTGYAAIRRGRRQLHRLCMVSAVAASALFLVGYLAYHYAHGDTKFQGTGVVRAVYLFVLATHVLLSMGIVPLALTSLYFALRGKLARHRKVARVTLPIWLYVSVTGVLIFFMLRGSAPAVP